jgi:hypothetical protein
MTDIYDQHKNSFRDGPAVRGLRALQVRPYRREEQLPRLIGLWPQEISDDAGGTAVILGRLRRALRAERQRGRAGHWAYDLNRHAALLEAIRQETALLKRCTQQRGG